MNKKNFKYSDSISVSVAATYQYCFVTFRVSFQTCQLLIYCAWMNPLVFIDFCSLGSHRNQSANSL